MVAGQVEAGTDRCRVIVVDDHAATADLLVEILTMEGYAVEVAHSAQEALEVARSYRPALALMDIGLPDVDGFALARLFKADPALAGIRLVALSGYEQSRQPKASQEQGCFDRYLIKPVDVEELLSVLADVLKTL